MNDSAEGLIKELPQELKPFIAKSYLEEKIKLKQDALECCQGLEDLLDMDGLEAGKWSIDDENWKLKEGETAERAISLILGRSVIFSRDLIKLTAIFKLGSEGYFSRQDESAFTSSILLHMPPYRLIEQILDDDYLSLFECIFLVGYYTDNSGIISHSIDIASQALMGGVISPRDPETNLKLKDLPKKRLTGEPVLPDLSWLLSFEEVEQWAVNNFDLSFKELRDTFKAPSKESLIQETQNQPDDTELTEEQKPDKRLDPRERNNMLKIIAAICEKAGVTADQDGLDGELEVITERLGIRLEKRAISKYLKKAAELVK
jgi:hypothetical protein